MSADAEKGVAFLDKRRAAKAAEMPTDTEMELARQFAIHGIGKLLYVPGFDWLAKDGPRHVRDQKLTRYTLANALCRAAGGDAEGSTKTRIESNKTASAIINLARPDMLALPADFDKLPYELNTPS